MKLSTFTKTIICTLLIFPFLTSCQTTKNNENTISADSYSESEDTEKEEIELPEIVRPADEEISMTAEESIKSAKKKTNAFQDFFTLGNKNELMICDTSSVFTTGISGKPVQKEAIIALNTEDGTAGFGSPYLAAYYIVQFDENGRKKLAKAVENYLSDFENKRLQRKGKNLYKQYGSVNAKLHWGALKSSTPNNGKGPVYFGYGFENQSPYFTISAFPVKNDYYDVAGESTTRESMNLKYYFTKAQAKELVNMLSDEKLQEYLGFTKPFKPEEADEY
ncbi:MAG: hypothetical protein K5681_03285 [Treponema sp.]|nr:hypothetical protein [Treponema sp.]